MESEKAEIFRYLGRHNHEISPELSAMTDECMSLMRRTATPRHVKAVFDIACHEDEILLKHAALTLKGMGITGHMSGCSQAVIFAATLGIAADNLIRYWQNIDLTRSLILDACATCMIEQYCDEIERKVGLEYRKKNLTNTNRFSPGYADFSLDIQPKLLTALDAFRKIGLSCTQSLILLPRKSVTALIGIGKDKDLRSVTAGCECCSQYSSCACKKGMQHD